MQNVFAVVYKHIMIVYRFHTYFWKYSFTKEIIYKNLKQIYAYSSHKS